MIKLEDIDKSFLGQRLLQGVSFAVPRGERVAITGPGGCGKTTLIKILLGLIKPERGKAMLFDVDVVKDPLARVEKTLRRVGIAFQQGGLFDFMTVKENLIFAMESMTTKTKVEMEETVTKLLADVKLPRTQDMYPHELSGGMKRRIGIARAMCTEPEIAFFDEPTSGLDPVTSSIILNMIGAMSETEGQKQPTMLIATSNVEIAIRFARRIIVINEGKIIADGPWRQLFIEGNEWVRKFLTVRLVGLDIEYARGLDLPEAFIKSHWKD